MESVSLLRTARAVHVRAGAALSECAWHAPAAPRRAGHGIPHHRVARHLPGAGDPVSCSRFTLQGAGDGLSRWPLAYSFLSPSYALFPAVEKDRGIVQLPWRIQVLAKYGEGPHNTGLTLLPLALAAAWLAGKAGGYRRILPAALLMAAIPLTNWVGGLSLGISSLLLLLAAWGEPEFRAWRVLAAAALAYLLACFWLTPSFVKTIAFNWPVDSFAYQLKDQQVWLLAGMAAGALVIRLLFRWWRGSFYFCLVTMGAFVFGWIATVFYLYGIDTIPESRRYAIEFEFFLTLALGEAFRLAMRSANGTVRLCAVGTGGVIFLVASPQLWAIATEGWEKWRPSPPETTVEYKLAQWIAAHPPQGRVFASGGMRFRLNSWFDLPQVGGDSKPDCRTAFRWSWRTASAPAARRRAPFWISKPWAQSTWWCTGRNRASTTAICCVRSEWTAVCRRCTAPKTTPSTPCPAGPWRTWRKRTSSPNCRDTWPGSKTRRGRCWAFAGWTPARWR